MYGVDNGGQLVRRKVVHDDDVTFAQYWEQAPFDIGDEYVRVRGAFDGHAGSRTVQAHRRRVPASVRSAVIHADLSP